MIYNEWRELEQRNEAEQRIEAELVDDERLLWYGYPPIGIVFRYEDIFIIPFSLLWGGYIWFILITAIVENAPLGFVLPASLMGAIGLYMIVGRFLMDALRRKHTFYGITSKRIIILNGIIRRRVRSVDIHTLSDVSVSDNRHGGGIIGFGTTPPPYGWRAAPSLIMWGHTGPPFFELASHIRSVYDIVQRARDAAA